MKLSSVMLFLGLALHSQGARAQGIAPRAARLLYVREDGTAHCPDENALRTSVAARLGYVPFRPDAQMLVVAKVRHQPNGLFARIELKGAGGATVGERELSSQTGDCTELASAMALAISIVVDPMSAQVARAIPPPSPPPPPPTIPLQPSIEEPSPEPPKRWVLGASGFLLAGVLPSPTVGGGLSFAHRWQSFSLGIEGRADLPGNRREQSREVSAALWTGTLAPCFVVHHVAGCALMTAGVLQSVGAGSVAFNSNVQPYAALGTRVMGEVPLGKVLAFQVRLDFSVPLAPVSLEVESVELWRSPAANFGLGMGFAVRL